MTQNTNESRNNRRVKLTEKMLRRVVSEAIGSILKEDDETLSPEQRLDNLRKQSSQYRPGQISKQKMDKVFNSGMGRLEFIQIVPEENLLLVNKALADRHDMERIKAAFPEYNIQMVNLGYPDYYFHGLKGAYKKQNAQVSDSVINKAIKESIDMVVNEAKAK